MEECRVAEVLLQMDGISKSFPGVKANDEVSFQINSGEITHYWAKTAQENQRL